jgi:N-acetyl-alpha-D-glucosaminyl L-malate synthase BshA
MVGDGPDRQRAEQRCRELKVCDKVRFLGKQEQVEEVLSISDLFLIPSGSETFGLAALEAMANSTPVISTNTGGLPEVNIDQVTGFTSNVGDVDEMAKNAIYILEDDDRLKAFKKSAFAKAEEFDITHIIPQYEALYTRVMKEQVRS